MSSTISSSVALSPQAATAEMRHSLIKRIAEKKGGKTGGVKSDYWAGPRALAGAFSWIGSTTSHGVNTAVNTVAASSGTMLANWGVTNAREQLEELSRKDEERVHLQKFDLLSQMLEEHGAHLQAGEVQLIGEQLRVDQELSQRSLLNALLGSTSLSPGALQLVRTVKESLQRGDGEQASLALSKLCIALERELADTRIQKYAQALSSIVSRRENPILTAVHVRVAHELHQQLQDGRLWYLHRMEEKISSAEAEAWRVPLEELLDYYKKKSFPEEEAEVRALVKLLVKGDGKEGLSRLRRLMTSIQEEGLCSLASEVELIHYQGIRLAVEEILGFEEEPIPEKLALKALMQHTTIDVATLKTAVSDLFSTQVLEDWQSDLLQQCIDSLRVPKEDTLRVSLQVLAQQDPEEWESRLLEGFSTQLLEQREHAFIENLALLRGRDVGSAVDGVAVNALQPLLAAVQEVDGIWIEDLPSPHKEEISTVLCDLMTAHFRQLLIRPTGQASELICKGFLLRLENGELLTWKELSEAESGLGSSLELSRLKGECRAYMIQTIKQKLYLAQGQGYLIQMDELQKILGEERKGSKRLLFRTAIDLLDGRNSLSENLQKILTNEAKDLLTGPLFALMEANQIRRANELLKRLEGEWHSSLDISGEGALSKEQEASLSSAKDALTKGQFAIAHAQISALYEAASGSQKRHFQRMLVAVDLGRHYKSPTLGTLATLIKSGKDRDLSGDIRALKLTMLKQGLLDDIEHLFLDASGLPSYPRELRRFLLDLRRHIELADIPPGIEPRDMRFVEAREQMHKSRPVELLLEATLCFLPDKGNAFGTLQKHPELDLVSRYQITEISERFADTAEHLREISMGAHSRIQHIPALLVRLASLERDLQHTQNLCDGVVEEELLQNLANSLDLLRRLQGSLRSLQRLDCLLERSPRNVELAIADLVDDAYQGRELSSAFSRLNHQVQARSDEFLLHNVVQTFKEEGLEGIWTKYFGNEASPQMQSSLASLSELIAHLKTEQGKEDVYNFIAVKIFHLAAGDENITIGQKQYSLKHQGLQFFLDLPEQDFDAVCDRLLEKWFGFVTQSMERSVETASHVERSESKAERFAKRMIAYGANGGLAKAADKALFSPLLASIERCELSDKRGLEAALLKVLEHIRPGERAALKEGDPAQRGPMVNLDRLYEMIVGDEGLSLLGAFIFSAWNQGISERSRPMGRSVMHERESELYRAVSAGGLGAEVGPLVEEATALLIAKLKDVREKPSPDHYHFDLTPLVVMDPDLQRETSDQEWLVLHSMTTKEGGIDLVLPRHTLELLVRVSILSALRNGKGLLRDFNRLRFGRDGDCGALLKHLAGVAASVCADEMRAPKYQDLDLDPAGHVHELGELLLGKEFASLPLSPGMQLLLQMLVAPGFVGSIPLRILGIQPLGLEALKLGTAAGKYDALISEALAHPRLRELLQERTQWGRNAYDDILKEGTKACLQRIWIAVTGKSAMQQALRTEEEQAFQSSCGRLVHESLLRLDAGKTALSKHVDWAYRNYPEQWNAVWADLIWKSVQDSIKDEVEGSREAFSTESLQRFVLQKATQALRGQRVELEREKPTALEKMLRAEQKRAERRESLDKVDQNLSLLLNYVEPLLERSSKLGLIIGMLPHFVSRILIQPVFYVAQKAVQLAYWIIRRPFVGSWAAQLAKVNPDRYRIKAREYHLALRNLVGQNQHLIHAIWNRVIGNELLSYMGELRRGQQSILKEASECEKGIDELHRLIALAEELKEHGIDARARSAVLLADDQLVSVRDHYSKLQDMTRCLDSDRTGYRARVQLLDEIVGIRKKWLARAGDLDALAVRLEAV